MCTLHSSFSKPSFCDFFTSTPSSTMLPMSRPLLLAWCMFLERSCPSAEPINISGAVLSVQPGCTRLHFAPFAHSLFNVEMLITICFLVLRRLEHWITGWFIACPFGGLLYTVSLMHVIRLDCSQLWCFINLCTISQFFSISLMFTSAQWFKTASTCFSMQSSNGGGRSRWANNSLESE